MRIHVLGSFKNEIVHLSILYLKGGGLLSIASWESRLKCVWGSGGVMGAFILLILNCNVFIVP